MFYDVIFALLMLFAGSSVLSHWLRNRPLIFMIYWGACAWLTLLAVLFALFDMLQVRAAAHREQRRLEAEYLERAQAAERHDENSPGA